MKKFIIFMVLNLLDTITTFIGLKSGCVEANLILNKIFQYNIYLGLGLKMLLALIVGLLILKFDNKLFKVLNIVFTAVVVINISSFIINYHLL